LYKPAYQYLNNVFEKLSNEYWNNERDAFPVSNNVELNDLIDKILSENNCSNCFGLGKDFANWSIHSLLKLKSFAYIDDYNLCDSFYNHIYRNGINHVSTAVVAALVDYDEIPENIRYSGVYDCFAQDRFISDAVIVLNTQEILDDNNFDYELFSKNITRFSRKCFIVRIDNSNIDKSKFKNILEQHYNNVREINSNGYEFFVAVEPLNWAFEIPPTILYQNDNRGEEDAEHSKKIIDVIKAKKRK
jgi:hypothetical protein